MDDQDTAVIIPDLGEIVERVRIVRWLKQVGDRVEHDEELLEVSTDKIDAMIQSPASGVVGEICAAEGEKVLVGAKVAVIRSG
jgi:2-oxoglutarate dehydrogenase E2 component (dihydrolipoamide succinyltransferase)